MKSLPHFCERDGGDKEMSAGASETPALLCVQDEVHRDARRTASGGIFGGSQSTVPRTESYQAMSRREAVRAAPLDCAAWARRCPAGLIPSCVSSQASRARARLGDRPFTRRIAISIVLTMLNASGATEWHQLGIQGVVKLRPPKVASASATAAAEPAEATLKPEV